MKNLTNAPASNPAFRYANLNVAGICCPTCKARTGKLLYTVTSAEAAQHFVLKEVDHYRNLALAEHIAELWGQTTCDVISCDVCGFIFANPYVGGDSIFYALAFTRTHYPAWKWEYQRTLDTIKDIVALADHPLKFLEIGAGDGAFVRKISPRLTLKDNILCLEYSEYGRNRILDYGIKCQGDDIRNLNLPKAGGGFDLICLFQVLEHMDRLDALFGKLNALSNSQAHLFISVPNAEQIEFNETHGCLLDMPPNHIGRWNLPAFKKLGATFGWAINEYQTEPFNLKDMLKQQVAYRYLKTSQNSTTLANKIERIKPEGLRKLLRLLCAGAYAIPRIDILYQSVSGKSRGDSQWVHLVKITNTEIEEASEIRAGESK